MVYQGDIKVTIRGCGPREDAVLVLEPAACPSSCRPGPANASLSHPLVNGKAADGVGRRNRDYRRCCRGRFRRARPGFRSAACPSICPATWILLLPGENRPVPARRGVAFRHAGPPVLPGADERSERVLRQCPCGTRASAALGAFPALDCVNVRARGRCCRAGVGPRSSRWASLRGRAGTAVVRRDPQFPCRASATSSARRGPGRRVPSERTAEAASAPPGPRSCRPCRLPTSS